MTSFEQRGASQDPFLRNTLGFIPIHHLAVFEPGPVDSVADLSMTVVPPEPTEEHPAYTTTIRQFADKANADKVMGEVAADVEQAVRFPGWIRGNPESRAKLDAYLDGRDAIEGNPRARLLEAAQDLVSARQAQSTLVLSPVPEVHLINGDTGDRAVVRLDVAGLIVGHPELLEETRTASQAHVGHESGGRKVWFRLRELLEARAGEIGISIEDSLAQSGVYELAADSSLYYAAGAANHPLASHWWQLHNGQQESGDHFDMGDPTQRLIQMQTMIQSTITDLRGLHEVTEGNSRVLPLEFRQAPDFEQAFLDVKAKVEIFSRRLAMINCGTNIAFGAVSPLPDGQRYEDLGPNEEPDFVDLGVDDDIRIALKQAVRAFGG